MTGNGERNSRRPGIEEPAGISSRFDVAIAGDMNLDLLLYGLPEDLEPERELLAHDMALCLGGSGAITAHNLASLGTRVGFVTAAADDEFGRLGRAQLQAAGVDLSHCVPVANERTGVTVHAHHQHSRHMLTYAGATFHLQPSDIDLDYIRRARHFHMPSYYLQSSLTSYIPELFRELKRAGLTISLDPNDDPAQTWQGRIGEALTSVDVLMPNERETCLLAKEENLEVAIEKLRSQVPMLIVKQGANGVSAFCGTEQWHLPARNVSVRDAVGAGDSFNAGFLHGWLRGWPMTASLAFGNFVAAWSTSGRGGTAAFRDAAARSKLKDEWAREAELLQIATS